MTNACIYEVSVWTEAACCGPRLHVVDGGMHVVHGLRVQWQNIRRVVAGAHKWSYEARMGTMVCNGSGVM